MTVDRPQTKRSQEATWRNGCRQHREEKGKHWQLRGLKERNKERMFEERSREDDTWILK